MKNSNRLILLSLFSIFLSSCNQDKAEKPVQEKNDHSQPCQPRYQIVFSPHKVADTFLIDTYTGKIWRPKRFVYLNGDPEIWSEEDVIDSTGKIGESEKFYERVYGVKKR